jgi:hypothetical protein
MSFFKRLTGVFSNPQQTFTALAEKPAWADVLVVILIAVVAFSLIIMPVLRSEQLLMMKDSAKLKEKMGEELFNRQVQKLENPPTAFDYIQTVVMGPGFLFVALLIQALFLMIFGRFVSSLGTFKQVFSALVHASLVNVVLGNAVRLLLVLTKKSVMQVSTGLALLFPKLEATSTAFVALNQVDIFQLWMFGVLAYGLAAVFKVSLKKTLVISYSFWLIKALVNTGIILFGYSWIK